MSLWVFDSECYKDYYLAAFRNLETGVVLWDEMYPGKPFGVPMEWLVRHTLVTFNGINYDFQILAMALAGCDNATLKAANDDIILGGLKPWHVADKYGGVDLSGLDHIDLIEVAPGKSSLKIYGGRMHSRRLQDLPIEPSASIAPEQREGLRTYCINDLDTTIDLYRELKPQIDLRVTMSAEFGIDLRSKSDAQIAEAVIRSEVERRKGSRVYRPELDPGYQFNYQPPAFIQFQSEGMRQAFNIIKMAQFSLGPEGEVKAPTILDPLYVRIGHAQYTVRIGGLHSNEKSISHKADDDTLLIDRDVTSYYPSIILTNNLYPAHMGPEFLNVYRSLVERRVEAKRRGDKVMADALKICVNGSFGKLGSKWSVLYSPDLLIQVTLTGQLALLMLIESIELAGIQVVSANTDGVVIKCPKSRKGELDAIIMAWEMVSGLNTEETEYRALYSKDVNNYIAIKPDGSAKLKGIYAKPGLSKNAQNEVATEAVIGYLAEGVPIETTIRSSREVRQFLTIRKVSGGATYDGTFLGKAVRWYYGAGENRHIKYARNGNKVARSDGARPLMELPGTLPTDIDYDWYIREAESILVDVGA